MRKIKFKVCYWNVFRERDETLFDTEVYEQAESFASKWEGNEGELYIKKVWVKQ